MATDLAKLVVKLEAESSRLQKGLDQANSRLKGFERRADTFAAKVKKTLGGAFVGIGAGLGFAALAGVFRRTIDEADQTDRQLRKLDAIIKSTGQSAGLTADDIDKFSRSLAASTLASTQGVRDAAGVLLTFRTISGDTFKETLTLAQDLAATLGSDLKSATLQLGKALEDPATGLSALRRSGVSFTEAEQELIKTLQASGRQFEAQGLILEKVRAQVGGAGAAEAGGLSGAVDTLSQRWSEFLESVGNSGAMDVAIRGVNSLARAVENLNRLLFTSEQDRFYELADRRAELLERLQKSQGRTGQARRQTSDIKRELAEVETEMRALQDRNIERMKKQRAAELAAEEEQQRRLQELREAAAVGQTTERKVERDKSMEQEAKQYNQQLASVVDRLDPAAAKTREYLASVDALNRAWAETGNDYYLELVDRLAEGTEELGDKADDTADRFKDLKGAVEGWGQSFADALLDGGRDMGNFADTVIKQLTRIALTRTFDPFFSLFGDWVSSSAGSLFGGFRAAGGPVNAGTSYIVGERGPELFVPGSSGSIVPNDKMGGSNVVVNVINKASGTQAITREREQNGQTIIDIMIEQVKGAIAADISRGAGSVPNALQGTYGLNRIAGGY